MTVQDAVAIMFVAAAAVFLFTRTISGPLSARTGQSCGSGCGKCSAGKADPFGLDRTQGLVTIGSPKIPAAKKPGQSGPDARSS